MQLAPCGHVPVHLVIPLVCYEEVQLLVTQALNELTPVHLVPSVGACSRQSIHHLGLAHHQDARQQGELRITHQRNLCLL